MTTVMNFSWDSQHKSMQFMHVGTLWVEQSLSCFMYTHLNIVTLTAVPYITGTLDM